jgi:hypothetical protein
VSILDHLDGALIEIQHPNGALEVALLFDGCNTDDLEEILHKAFAVDFCFETKIDICNVDMLEAT